jgi:hypothetical protein
VKWAFFLSRRIIQIENLMLRRALMVATLPLTYAIEMVDHAVYGTIGFAKGFAVWWSYTENTNV